MQRLVLTQSQHDQIDAKRTELGVQPTDVVVEGSNLVPDDNLRVMDTFDVWVIGADSGLISSYVPDYDMILPFDIIDHITDRAGPNGETMPIFDPVQAEARTAAKAGGTVQNPKMAAKEERKEERAHRRDIRDMLHDAIKRLPRDQQKPAREKIRAAGVLGKDD